MQHRRAGIGRDAATLIFDRFAGEWEIVEYMRHPGSVAFWRHVVARYSGGHFTERSQQRRSAAAIQEPAVALAKVGVAGLKQYGPKDEQLVDIGPVQATSQACI